MDRTSTPRGDYAVGAAAWVALAFCFVVAAMLARTVPASAQGLTLTPLPKGETRTVKLAVGGVADTTHIAVWYALHGGFFEQLKADGITVEVVPFGSGAEWLLALTSGQAQMAHGYFENAVRARSQGRDVTSIYNVLPTPVLQIIVRKDRADTIKTVKDAKDAVWGFTAFGSATHVVSLRAAKFVGLDQASVKWTPVGGTTGFLPSMREKRVDLLTSTVFAAVQLIDEGTATMLLDMTDPKVVKEIWGDYLGPALLSSKDYLAKNPFVAFKVSQAVADAIAGVRSLPPEEIAKVLPAQFQTPSLKESIRVMAKSLSADGISKPEAAAAMVADMGDLKVGKDSLKTEDLIDNRFAEAIIAGKKK